MTVRNTKNLYHWKGLDNQGNVLLGCNHASSIPILKNDLFKQGIIIREVNKQHELFINLRRWLANKHTLLFLTQLSAMLKTGINLGKAIEILRKNQTQGPLTRLLADTHRQLNTGQCLSASLRTYPVLFDNIVIQLIKSGEASGRIDRAVQKSADYYSQKQQTTNLLLTALLYPLILGLVTAGVLVTMLVFVIPQFESIYAQSGNQLPALTRVILTMSDWIRNNGSLLTIIIFFTAMAFYSLKKTLQIEFSNYIPKINYVMRKIHTLRFCQTLAELYNAGLPITDCLDATRNLSPNIHYIKTIDQSLADIKEGHSLASALNKTDYFDPMLIQLIKTGEESASLAQMLEQCANYYSDDLSNALTRLKIILEPFLIVFLGGIIGVILVAMYLPVFNAGSTF